MSSCWTRFSRDSPCPLRPRGSIALVAEQLADLARPIGPGVLPGRLAALAAFSNSVSSGSLSSAARSAQGSAAARQRGTGQRGNERCRGSGRAAGPGSPERAASREPRADRGRSDGARAGPGHDRTAYLRRPSGAGTGLRAPDDRRTRRAARRPARRLSATIRSAFRAPVASAARPAAGPNAAAREGEGTLKHPQHEKTPKPAHSPEPGGLGRRGHPPQSLSPSASS